MTYRFLLGSLCLATAVAASAQGFKNPQQAPSSGSGLRGAAGISAPVPLEGRSNSASSSASPRSADYIVAVVNSEPVTNFEVQQRTDRALAQLQSQGGEIPPREAVRREMLERIIAEKIQLQMATEAGIKVDNFALQQAEQSVARQNNLSVEEMASRLSRDGISRDQFRADLRRQLVIQKLREAEVDSKVRVNDLDVDQFIREQKTKSGTPTAAAQINLGHILIAVPENAGEQQVKELQAKAQAAADKAKAGEDFLSVVREYSDAPDGRGGGAMGLRPADRYPELFVNATKSAPVGGVVGPVRSPAGFHVLKLIEKSSGDVPVIAVQSHARHILLRPSAKLSEAQAVERLEDYRRRITANQADFADLARRYSEDGSAKGGGDLGWAGPHKFVPEFQAALDHLQPGEVSEPVASRFGIHLIQLLERREAKLSQREQRDMVRDQVREQKLEKAFGTWAQEARARAYVEYREPPQ
ncbi:peptidylprolyl isomerase [Comamonas humi]